MANQFAEECRRRARITIAITVGLSFLFLCALWAVAAGSISSSRQAALDHAQIEGRNLSVAFADEVRRSLDGISAAMDIVAQRMRTQPGNFDIHQWQQEVPILALGAIHAAIISPDGRLASSTLGPAVARIDLSDREHFRVHLESHSNDIFISKPLFGRLIPRTMLQVSRRVESDDGKLLGVVVFSVAPASLTALHRSIDLGPKGTLALIGLDKIVRARFDREHTDGLSGVGQSIAAGFQATVTAPDQEGAYVVKSIIDGTVRHYSYRRVGHYPLLVTVGFELRETLGAVRTHEVVVLLIASTVSVLLVGLGGLLVSEIRRRSRNEIALAEERAKLEADIALRRQMERQLIHAEKMEAIGTLAGGVAHELNNALLPIVILAQVLLSKLPDTGTEHDCAKTIAAAGERAQGLVKGILTFSRKQDAAKTEVDLAALVSDLLPMLDATLPKTIKLATELAPVPPINADRNALQGVIVNMVTNAAHAIGERPGQIAISVDESLMTNSAGSALAVRLRIADTGCGMDAKTADHIFEPFYTTKAVGVGTGLGLSVAHGVVTDHGGHITVHSEPGEGTEFSILLPACTISAQPLERAA